MKKGCIHFFVLFLLFFSFSLVGQSVEELKQNLASVSGTAKVDLLNKIGRAYWYSDPALSIEYGQQALEEALVMNYEKGQGVAYNNMGVVYKNQGDYPKALDFHFKALKIREQAKDEDGMAASYSNLGSVYQHQGNYSESLKYYEKCLELDQKSGVQDYIASTLGSIGNVYRLKGDFDKALEYHERSLEIGRASGDKNREATSLENIGNTYRVQGNNQQAIEHLDAALVLFEELNHQVGVAAVANSLAEIYMETGNMEMAAKRAKRSLEMAREMELKPMISEVAKTLSAIYEFQGDFDEALNYHKIHKIYQDSVLNEESNIKASSIAFSFELEKKEAEVKLEKEKAANRTLGLYFSGFAVLLMGVLAVVFFRGREKQKKAKEVIEEVNAEISQKNEEIQTQNEELQQQQQEILAINDKLSEQTNNLEKAFGTIKEKNELLTNSIRAAEHMQKALLPSSKNLSAFFPNHFLLFRPRDIVSGDFYWADQLNGRRYLVEADCTGHGVPGALMTMIGINLLNRMILQNKIDNPAHILEALDLEIVRLLNPEETGSEEGMDMTLCVFDKMEGTQQKVQVVSAKQNFYVVKNGEVEVFSGTNRNIGGSRRKGNKFEIREFVLDKGDRLFIASDGYVDQNNLERKKLGQLSFKDLLKKGTHLTIQEHAEFLDAELHEYMVGTDQRDDILLIGIEI